MRPLCTPLVFYSVIYVSTTRAFNFYFPLDVGRSAVHPSRLLQRLLLYYPGFFRWPVFLCLLVFEQRTIRGPDTMSTNQEENVAQQQPGGSDGYSPFKMAGSPYSPFKNGAPEPHHTSHQMSRPDAFAHVVACCAQATRRQNRRRLLRSPLRCGPLGFPRLAARPPAASVGRHEAAARV